MFAFLAALLTACEAPPTPIAVIAFTPTPPPAPTQPIYRVGIAPELVSLFPPDIFPAGTRVEMISPETAPSNYDVQIGINAWEGALQSAATLYLDLRVHALPPLDTSEMVEALSTALSSQTNDAPFALLGYPDGFDLRLFSPPEFAERTSTRLSLLGLRVNMVNHIGDAHLDLIASINPSTETDGETRMMSERVPLYYTASEPGCALMAAIIPLCAD